MSGEWEDVVFGYINFIYRKTGKPVSIRSLRDTMDADDPGTIKYLDFPGILEELKNEGLIKREGFGYVPRTKSEALRIQLKQPGVKPFSREYGETPEAHMDKVWDFREGLVKPEAGGKWGLGATGHLLPGDAIWEGLEQDLDKGVK